MNFSDFTFHAAALGRFVPALLNAGLISHQGGAKAQLNLLPNLARYRFTTAREIEQGYLACPERLALIDDDGTLTYRQLRSHTQNFARYLESLELPEIRLGVMARNGRGIILPLAAKGYAGADIFLREVQEEGLHAIVRPGPYICAEFDGGGFPAWLFRDPEVGVRTLEPRYMAAVTDYLRAVMDIVAPLQIDRGGPVILLQVENEYGAYGSDHAYLQALTDLFRETGATVPLDGLAAASALPSAPLAAGANVFQATVTLPASADLALSTEGLGKGLVWVNGFCLGRYWRAGPQHTLFVPGPATRVGENLVTVLELEALTADALRFVPDLDLGHTDS